MRERERERREERGERERKSGRGREKKRKLGTSMMVWLYWRRADIFVSRRSNPSLFFSQSSDIFFAE
jgi:hypothetical protein